MEKRSKAIITGAIGQDGSFLTQLLCFKGYEVHGIIRPDTSIERTKWLESICPYMNVTLHRLNVLDKTALSALIKEVNPTEIYNFAAVSNVFNPIESLDEVFEINAKLPQYILDIIYHYDRSIRFFQASSCLIFGKDAMGSQNELTLPNPLHFYGAAKLYADNVVKMFREDYGLFCCSGIFFNHESERRGINFFSKKIAKGAVDIKNGSKELIKVGNLHAWRDYGYAKDFVEAAYLMLNAPAPSDYVIGTGSIISMADYCKKCFEYVGIDNYEDHIDIDEKLYRKIDTHTLRADISKIKRELGWEPKHNIDNIIKIIVEDFIYKYKDEYSKI